MKKNQVNIGQIVKFQNQTGLVIRKFDETVSVCDVTESQIIECAYEDIHPDTSLKLYNNAIREANSTYNGKFVKNTKESNFIFEDGSKVWFTSDTHFCHDNILKFCNRPFANVQEMNKALVDNWNSVIGPDDDVFHLGDFCWGGSANWNYLLDRLNGRIHLVIGNHDVKNLRQGYMSQFASSNFQIQIEVEGRKVYLNHYPLLTYGGVYRKDEDKVWQLFGHVHSQNGQVGADESRLHYLLPTQYDVGVDNNNYTPINFHQVRDIINKQISEQKQAFKEIDNSHLELKNQILMSLLTPEQIQTYIELTTDNGNS